MTMNLIDRRLKEYEHDWASPAPWEWRVFYEGDNLSYNLRQELESSTDEPSPELLAAVEAGLRYEHDEDVRCAQIKAPGSYFVGTGENGALPSARQFVERFRSRDRFKTYGRFYQTRAGYDANQRAAAANRLQQRKIVLIRTYAEHLDLLGELLALQPIDGVDPAGNSERRHNAASLLARIDALEDRRSEADAALEIDALYAQLPSAYRRA